MSDTINTYTNVKYPDITVQLSGEDGDAMSIIARVSSAIRKDHGEGMAKAYREEAMSGDYNHLLTVTQRTVHVL